MDITATAWATGSAYIRSQIERLESELGNIQQQLEATRGVVLDAHDTTLTRAARDVASKVGQLCDTETAEKLAASRTSAWLPALTLAAALGPGKPQSLTWLGLLLGAPLAAASMGLGSVTALIMFLAGYGGLVHWGRLREAERTSKPDRDAISAFRALKPVLVACDQEPSGNEDYPYKLTMAPVPEDANFFDTYRFDQKRFGQQFGATYLGFRDLNGKTCILSRMADNGFTAMVIPINDLNERDPRWPMWCALAGRAASAASEHCGTIRAYAEQVNTMFGVEARVRLLKQRVETLRGVDHAWADVALPVETLDNILRLVDSFKAGRPVKGILLYGPPGTGKTLIARKLARHAGCHFLSAGIADLKSEHIGGTGPKVKDVWKQCRENAPTILFIDECESVFATRGSSDSDRFGAELVQTFLAEWDGFNQSTGQVFVIGATNRRDLLDNAVISRFTETIEVGTPDADGRRKILGNELKKAHLDFAPTDDMVRETTGMSGRDIHTLVSKIVAFHLHGDVSQEQFSIEVRRIRGKQSTLVERMGWDDLVLPEDTLNEFKSLGHELVNAEDLRKLGISVPRGILLYGPPGTGKTQLARVLASESGLAFIAASSSDLKAGYTGQSGGKVKELLERARAQAPCILFLDEIDTIAPARGAPGSDSFTAEIVAQLLQELDGVATRKGQVFLLGASNHPDGIDPALLSRFERKIEIGLPDEASRAAILLLQLQNKPLDFDAEQACVRIASETGGMSGRDLQSLVTSATRRAVQRAISTSGDPRKLILTRSDLDYSQKHQATHIQHEDQEKTCESSWH